MKMVVIHLSCDNCSNGPVTHEEFPSLNEAGAIKLARRFGWSVGKKCICPECLESKLSPEALKRLEHKRRVFELRESGAIVYTVVDNSGHSSSCDHGASCLDEEQGEKHSAIFATENDLSPEDYHCALCMDDSFAKETGRHMAFIDNGTHLFSVGSDEWKSYLKKLKISITPPA